MNLKSLLPLLFAGAALSCQRTISHPTPLADAVWYAKKCTNASNEEILCPYSFLRFHKNGIFIGGALRGYVSGVWKQDTVLKQVLLLPDSLSDANEKYPTLLQFTYHSSNYLNFLMARDESDIQTGNIQLLRMKAGKVKDDSDPFSLSLQQWRNKPEMPENAEQIKSRTQTYLRFLEQFYLFASANVIEKPDTDWFPNVLLMENSGSVRLTYSSELTDWYACFYDEAQAIEGYKLISGPFLNVKLKAIENQNLRNADVVSQILRKF